MVEKERKNSPRMSEGERVGTKKARGANGIGEEEEGWCGREGGVAEKEFTRNEIFFYRARERDGGNRKPPHHPLKIMFFFKLKMYFMNKNYVILISKNFLKNS